MRGNFIVNSSFISIAQTVVHIYYLLFIYSFNFLFQSRPLSAGDALLRQQVRPPVKMITTSVGGCPVELVDVSISAQNSLSDSSSSSPTEIDGDLDTTDELEDVETVTTTAAAMGLVTTVTTTKKKRKSGRHNPNTSVSHMITSPEVSPNNLGLDVEMRHVAEVQELVS